MLVPLKHTLSHLTVLRNIKIAIIFLIKEGRRNGDLSAHDQVAPILTNSLLLNYIISFLLFRAIFCKKMAYTFHIRSFTFNSPLNLLISAVFLTLSNCFL